MSRMIEVTKLQDGTYDVNPNAAGGGSPLNMTIPAFDYIYGVIIFLDNEDNPLAIDNVETFDYSVVYTIFEPSDYDNRIYHRGTEFDEIRFEGTAGQSSRAELYKNGDYQTSIDFGSATSTSEFTIAHVIGIN